MTETTVVFDSTLEQPMNEIFVVMALDEKGNEGIVTKNGLPLVSGHMKNLKRFIEQLSEIGKMCHKKVRLCRFVRTEVIRESK